MAGQRASDLMAAAAALRERAESKGRKLRLAANGSMTVPALFAAALDPRIDELYLAGHLISYRDVVEADDYRAAFANFVPRILLHTDLPEIAQSIAPRRIVLAGPVDARGRTAPDRARELYAAPHIEIAPRAQWDEAALSFVTRAG
jgi:hypothetical protein